MSKRKSMSGKNSPISKKLARGTLYQTKPGGTFYFRYQINGMRKTQSMQTKDISVAEKKLLKISYR